MTDINKVILEKNQGTPKLNPDEQRKYLETFEERVIGVFSVDEVENPIVLQHFKEILKTIVKEYGTVTIKISPVISSTNQIFYLKIAKECDCQATIVSSNCQNSPFGLVIHSSQVVDSKEKKLMVRFDSILNPDKKEDNLKKTPFWKKLF